MNSRDKRRLARIGRMLALARIERREALGALAGSIAEEARSRKLAARSRTLAGGYAGRGGVEAGADLAERIAFVGGLSRLATDAEASGQEAAQEADTHMRSLTGAERRIERLEIREAQARRALEEKLQRRAADPAATLARKLQKHP
jgi:hypothetical protein